MQISCQNQKIFFLIDNKGVCGQAFLDVLTAKDKKLTPLVFSKEIY